MFFCRNKDSSKTHIYNKCLDIILLAITFYKSQFNNEVDYYNKIDNKPSYVIKN